MNMSKLGSLPLPAVAVFLVRMEVLVIPRLLSGFVALVLAGLAVGLPIVLTEAGTSKSTSDTKNAYAQFSYVDSSTGHQFEVWVWATEGTFSYSSPGNNSGAKSNRPYGSTRPHGPDSFSDEYVNVQIDELDANFDVIASYSGFAQPDELVIEGDLSSGHLVADVDMYEQVGDPEGPYLEVFDSTATVELDWTATGALTTYRSNDRSQTRSPRSSYHSISVDTYRQATANGEILFHSMNLAQGGSEFAELSTSDRRTLFQY